MRSGAKIRRNDAEAQKNWPSEHFCSMNEVMKDRRSATKRSQIIIVYQRINGLNEVILRLWTVLACDFLVYITWIMGRSERVK